MSKILSHKCFFNFYIRKDNANCSLALQFCYRAKRFPIKVESGASAIYKGSRIFYIYLETPWEKEAWCKALRLASFEDEEKIKWLAKLNVEFQNYVTLLNAAYPSFMKPSSSFGAELVDKSSKPDGPSAKVRQFLKKLTKKGSKNAQENKASCSSKSGHEERKLIEKGPSFQDLDLPMAPTRKPLDFSNEDVIVPSSTASVISDADSDDRVTGDEGSLCWNLLIARLFFDAKRNEQMKSFVQERIQVRVSFYFIISLVIIVEPFFFLFLTRVEIGY